MHFTTLVAVDIDDYPVCKETDENIGKQIELLSLCNTGSKYDSIYIKCRIGELKSLTNSFARAVDSAVEYKLEPYCECTDNFDYLEFVDETDGIKAEYETGMDCIKLPNGTIQPLYMISNKFCIKNGLVYQKDFGPHKQDKRSKKAKRLLALPQYPFKKLYKSLEEFAVKYRGLIFNEERKAYGYYYNPNSFWDWYRIGGRWPCTFLVKDDCEEFAPGNYDEDYEIPTPPNGYKWTSAARKKDTQWQTLIEYEKEQMKKRFDFYCSAFEKKELPQNEWFLKIKEDGIYHYSNFAVYLNGETFEENQVRRKYHCDSDYLSSPCYYVDNENWHTDTGWWSRSEVSENWKEEVKNFYGNLPDDTVLVCVDCHD